MRRHRRRSETARLVVLIIVMAVVCLRSRRALADILETARADGTFDPDALAQRPPLTAIIQQYKHYAAAGDWALAATFLAESARTSQVDRGALSVGAALTWIRAGNTNAASDEWMALIEAYCAATTTTSSCLKLIGNNTRYALPAHMSSFRFDRATTACEWLMRINNLGARAGRMLSDCIDPLSWAGRSALEAVTQRLTNVVDVHERQLVRLQQVRALKRLGVDTRQMFEELAAVGSGDVRVMATCERSRVSDSTTFRTDCVALTAASFAQIADDGVVLQARLDALELAYARGSVDVDQFLVRKAPPRTTPLQYVTYLSSYGWPVVGRNIATYTSHALIGHGDWARLGHLVAAALKERAAHIKIDGCVADDCIDAITRLRESLVSAARSECRAYSAPNAMGDADVPTAEIRGPWFTWFDACGVSPVMRFHMPPTVQSTFVPTRSYY